MATAEPLPPENASAAAQAHHHPDTEANGGAAGPTPPEKRWPGWPGDCVFRLVVPVGKVGSIIGRKGELIKKMCEETRARIRVLDAAIGTPDRIVLVSGKEEPEAALSPAMEAVIRVFKRVSGLSETDAENKESAAGLTFCSIRLLVASTQAINLIGKQGSLIKSIQENTGAAVRVLSGDEVQFYASTDERIVEMQGEALKVLKALEAVVSHLRKFLVDHSVLPLFEKSYNAPILQDRQAETWSDKSLLHTNSQTSIFADIPLPTKRDSVLTDRESQLDSLFPSSTVSLYGQDSSLSSVSSSALGRVGAPIVTTVIQTMQIPLSYAEDIIGIQGTNIDYIRRTSGAILTVQESRVPDEIIVEIKGTSSQVQTAQQLIQEVISNHKEPVTSSYGRLDAGLRSSYSQLGTSSRFSSSLSSQPYAGYGASGLGDYSTFRL
ncbi:RNA-binding KH domain-containing protein PEPPER-like [Abrus precatorius]|uniref:RNA-binding KH domain-containing protein PEPPER-like n=1 Tax=Abrus precatorius TaxID=3816 RepID=A0A8B8JUF1_ABRPR|nr:RNA-binding KH domain-containing protein PEPPER-like [Abrus precatorius]